MKLYWKYKNDTSNGYEVIVNNPTKRNYNEDLNSATCLISHLDSEIDIEILDEVRLDNYWFCIEDYTETLINPGLNQQYNYEIKLISQAKLLEGFVLPNLSITKTDEPRSIYYYINQYLMLYSPKIQAYGHLNRVYKWDWWTQLSNNTKLNNTICPEMQWNRPTLREVLNDLMMVVDYIPTLDNDIIGYLDLTERKDDEITNINYVNKSKSLSDYASGLEMELQNVIQDKQEGTYNLTNMVEYTGFRNEDDYVLTTENLKVYTRNPIYNIKHLWLCLTLDFTYIDKDSLGEQETKTSSRYYAEVDLCNISGYNLVKEYKEWQILPLLYRTSDISKTIKDISLYKNFNIYYNRGGNYLDNFSNYTKAWWFFTVSSMEIILECIGKELFNKIILPNKPEGHTYNISYLKIYYGNGSSDYIRIIGGTDNPDVRKILSFKVEYESLANTKFKSEKCLYYPTNERNVIDNQTNSYVNANRQGLLEYMKINRLGNELIVLNARYDNLSQVADLGSVYGNDNVVFSEEIKINPNYVDVNYYCTKHYILKDYYTGVKAKIRSWKIENEESLVRNDLKKVYFEFSFDYGTSHVEDVELITNKQNYELVELGLSSLECCDENENIKNAFLEIYTELEELPATRYNGYFYYCVELNNKVLGNSIVFNTQMKDNYCVGLTADGEVVVALNKYGEREISYVDGKGEFKDINFILSKTPDFGEGNFTFPSMTEEENGFRYSENPSSIVLYDVSKRKPLATQNILPDTVDRIKCKYNNIFKDQREITALSMQFEYCTKSKDIVFGSQFVKDNAMITTNYRSGTGTRSDLRVYYSGKKVKIYDMNYLPDDIQPSGGSVLVLNNTINVSLGTAGKDAYYITDSQNRVLFAFNRHTNSNNQIIYLHALDNRNRRIYSTGYEYIYIYLAFNIEQVQYVDLTVNGVTKRYYSPQIVKVNTNDSYSWSATAKPGFDVINATGSGTINQIETFIRIGSISTGTINVVINEGISYISLRVVRGTSEIYNQAISTSTSVPGLRYTDRYSWTAYPAQGWLIDGTGSESNIEVGNGTTISPEAIKTLNLTRITLSNVLVNVDDGNNTQTRCLSFMPNFDFDGDPDALDYIESIVVEFRYAYGQQARQHSKTYYKADLQKANGGWISAGTNYINLTPVTEFNGGTKVGYDPDDGYNSSYIISWATGGTSTDVSYFSTVIIITVNAKDNNNNPVSYTFKVDGESDYMLYRDHGTTHLYYGDNNTSKYWAYDMTGSYVWYDVEIN